MFLPRDLDKKHDAGEQCHSQILTECLLYVSLSTLEIVGQDHLSSRSPSLVGRDV